MFSTIEQHYIDNYQKFLKFMTFKAGTPEAAEDIIQETYYRALKYHETCDAERLDKWISMIMHNCLRDMKRDENGTHFIECEEEESEDDPFIPSQIMKEVMKLIYAKSKEHKEILLLHIKHQYSPKDISESTHYTYSNCKQVILRFRKELKEIYRE